jgi:L-seryl-tRNA(Ser) seleniumtransferase
VVYSGHKFLGGPTTGIVAGRADLVRAARLQNRGIGRGMKVGKESIAGVMAALRAWQQRDHAGIRAREVAALDLWLTALQGVAAVRCTRIDDPTGNPLQRLRVHVLPASGWTARTLATTLARGEPPIMVRDYQTDLGYIDLDPCNLHPGEEHLVAQQLVATLGVPA